MFHPTVSGLVSMIAAVLLLLTYHNVIPLRGGTDEERMAVKKKLRPLVWILCPALVVMGILQLCGVF